MAPARRQFDRLPPGVATAVLETLDAIAANPRRLGKRLALEHEGRFSARRGPYRIIYELSEDQHTVRVIAIGHRRDIYPSAVSALPLSQHCEHPARANLPIRRIAPLPGGYYQFVPLGP